MSYSRWSNSVFYTFWCGSLSNERDEQLFDVCAVATFTYDQLVTDMEACINMIKALPKSKYSEHEYEELRGYMKEFIEDVKDHYNTPSQQYKDGEITLEEAFLGEI